MIRLNVRTSRRTSASMGVGAAAFLGILGTALMLAYAWQMVVVIAVLALVVGCRDRVRRWRQRRNQCWSDEMVAEHHRMQSRPLNRPLPGPGRDR